MADVANQFGEIIRRDREERQIPVIETAGQALEAARSQKIQARLGELEQKAAARERARYRREVISEIRTHLIDRAWKTDPQLPTFEKAVSRIDGLLEGFE